MTALARGAGRATAAAATALLVAAVLSAQAVAPAPVLGPPPALRLPDVTAATLPNGLRVEVAEMHEVPVVEALLVIKGGARLDGDQPGLATFTAGMLNEGAGSRNAATLAADLELLGASLSTGAGWDNTTVQLRAPRRTFDRAAELMADVVLRPTFRAEDVARQRGLRIASILQERVDPAAMGSLAFAAAVFPPGHPYHQPINGDSASTIGLDSATVATFWQREADPQRATLFFAGDITLSDAVQLARARFGGWRAPATPLAAPAPARLPEPARPATRIILVDKPGAAQSVINIGAPGVSRLSADYPALMVMNTVLGGSFSSWLNAILREEKGFTYGARSEFVWRPVPGPFVAGAAVRTNVTDSSLAIFFQQFHRLRHSLVSQVELTRARNYLALGMLGAFETTAQVARGLSNLAEFGLPLSAIPRELDGVRRVTAGEVERVARKYVDPDHLTVIVVGDVPKIRPGIEKLNLGPVTVLAPENLPAPAGAGR